MAAKFSYGLRQRPAGLGAIPKGSIGLVPPVINEANVNLRHGIALYDRYLTPLEVSQFELVKNIKQKK